MAKVMLVEDDPTMLALLNTFLEIEGYQVAQMNSFENVLEEIRSHNPDIVLMDVHLQDVDGMKLLESIRQDGELKETVIIMSSGMDFSEESMSKGANEFLLKPYMPEELISKIKRLLGN